MVYRTFIAVTQRRLLAGCGDHSIGHREVERTGIDWCEEQRTVWDTTATTTRVSVRVMTVIETIA